MPRSTLGATMATATTALPATEPRRATSHHLPPLCHPSELFISSPPQHCAMVGRTIEIMSWPWQSNTSFPSHPDFSKGIHQLKNAWICSSSGLAMIANTKGSLHYLLFLVWRQADCLSALIKDKYCLGTCMTVFILVSLRINIRFISTAMQPASDSEAYLFYQIKSEQKWTT